jgi:hypothetical protein
MKSVLTASRCEELALFMRMVLCDQKALTRLASENLIRHSRILRRHLFARSMGCGGRSRLLCLPCQNSQQAVIADACLDACLFCPPPRAADQIGSRQSVLWS